MIERPILFSGAMVRAVLEGNKIQTRRVVNPQPEGPHGIVEAEARCRYGQPGDRLWVRETWADLTATHGQRWERRNPSTGLYERGQHPFFWYAADGDQPDLGGGERNPERWRPSIHMPRHACRLVLEVVRVRVQPLHAITPEDIIAEGLHTRLRGHDAVMDLRDQWQELWTGLNGPVSWQSNPWVYAIDFRVMP